MGALITVLLLALILGGAGFAVHVLWWVALVVLVLWVLGFVFHGSGRWYRW
ncbi:hydrophobic protein [Kitasatospora sp. NPDC054795]